MCFPRKGTLTLPPGMGVGWGDHLGPKIPKSRKESFVRKLFTLLGHVSPKLFKDIFWIYSYTQKTTPNPINALKIKNYSIKHTRNTKVIPKTSNVRLLFFENLKIHILQTKKWFQNDQRCILIFIPLLLICIFWDQGSGGHVWAAPEREIEFRSEKL